MTSRLAFISGILPAGEVFDEGAHRIILDAEFENLEHLQKTISHLREGFSTYRKTHDNRCKPFEDRATEYLSQIFKEDSAAAPDSRREVVNHDTLDLSQPLVSKAPVPNSDTPPEVGKNVHSEETLSDKKHDGGSEANAGVDDASSAKDARDPSLAGVQADASKDIAAVSVSKSMESQLVPASTLFLPPKLQSAAIEEHSTKIFAADGDGKLEPGSSSIQDLVSYKLGDLPDGGNNIAVSIKQFYLRVTSIDMNSKLADKEMFVSKLKLKMLSSLLNLMECWVVRLDQLASTLHMNIFMVRRRWFILIGLFIRFIMVMYLLV